jgi:type IV pilus assembly protein PilM
MAKPKVAKGQAKNVSKTIAVDIGSKNIKILRGTLNKNGTVSISDVIIEPTPEGCIENGYVKSQTDLNLFLRALIGKNDMSKCDAHVVVRSSDIVTREISVPAVKGFKLKKLIENEIVTVFGNTADYYTDYVANGTEVVDYQTLHKLSAYAVPKEIVSSYMDVINSADAKPAVFDVHRNVISKLLADGNVSINQEPISGKTVLLVDIGASYMDIDLIIDGVDVYKRSVSIADDVKASEDTTSSSASMEDQIDALYSGGSEYDGYEGYESYDGYEYGSGNDDYMYGSGNQSKISPVLSRANEEIYKIMQFALQKYSNKPVTKIYLYGGNSRLQGLDQYLSTALEVAVDKICSISNVEISSDVNLADVLIAAGSLIRK